MQTNHIGGENLGVGGVKPLHRGNAVHRLGAGGNDALGIEAAQFRADRRSHLGVLLDPIQQGRPSQGRRLDGQQQRCSQKQGSAHAQG